LLSKIAAKIDFTPDYAAAICYLLEHGEEQLLIAIERGLMPANIAIKTMAVIARARTTSPAACPYADGSRSRHPGNAPAESPQAVARYTRRRKQASNAWYPVANG
jgi:hypothetical protein